MNKKELEVKVRNLLKSGAGTKFEVIIGEGEQRFTLWGSEGTSFEGQLMVAESTLIEAEEKFDELIEQYRTTGEQEFENTHQKDKISSRYLMQVLPVCKLQSEVPEVYLVDLAFTSKLTFGKFSAQVFKGVFSKIGIPAKTGMSAVVVNMRTEGKVNDA